MSGDAPDSALVRRAWELVGEASPTFLLNHSHRCFLWAEALAERDRVAFDAELLSVAAAFHDLGLVAGYDTGRCFEDDGADAAVRHAAEAGWPAGRREALGEAIRLHMAVAVGLEEGPEAYLLWQSTSLDVSGHRYGDLPPHTVEQVLAEHPRLDFKAGFTALFVEQAELKGGCRAAALVQEGIVQRIASTPFSS